MSFGFGFGGGGIGLRLGQGYGHIGLEIGLVPGGVARGFLDTRLERLAVVLDDNVRVAQAVLVLGGQEARLARVRIRVRGRGRGRGRRRGRIRISVDREI